MIGQTPPRFAFVGNGVYSTPFEEGTTRKFAALERLGTIIVVANAPGSRFGHFTCGAEFFLLPRFSRAILRRTATMILQFLMVLYLAAGRGVRTFFVQSPLEGGLSAVFARIVLSPFIAVAVVTELHGDIDEAFFLQYKPALPTLSRKLMTAATDLVIRGSVAFRAVSSATLNQLARRVHPDQKIVVFPAWIDLEVFQSAARVVPHRDPHLILYAGGINPIKDIKTLLDAFIEVAREDEYVKLVLAGPIIKPDYYVGLVAMVSTAGLSNRVRFLGRLPQVELARLAATARVLVLPSLSESFGRVLVEAMATGCPAIGSRVGGIQEVIQDGVNGLLFEAQDSAGLASTLIRIINDDDLWARLSRGALQASSAIFTTERYVSGYKALLDEAERKH